MWASQNENILCIPPSLQTPFSETESSSHGHFKECFFKHTCYGKSTEMRTQEIHQTGGLTGGAIHLRPNSPTRYRWRAIFIFRRKWGASWNGSAHGPWFETSLSWPPVSAPHQIASFLLLSNYPSFISVCPFCPMHPPCPVGLSEAIWFVHFCVVWLCVAGAL